VQHLADPAVLDVQARAHGYLGALDALLLRRQTHLAYLQAVAQGDVSVHRPSRALRQLASALDALRAETMALPSPPAEELAAGRLTQSLRRAAGAARALSSARGSAPALRAYARAVAKVNRAVERMGAVDAWRATPAPLLRPFA
jgi:hypothetical protein